jgi:GNAT superfamily N-acetyltransferase
MDTVIRKFEERDFDAVMRLVRECYGETAEPPEWWRWRHFEFDGEATTMFLAVCGTKIVGMRPLTLFDYYVQGRPVKGGLFSAVMVHPDHRRKGLFSKMVNACIEEAWRRGASFVNTMPNDTSYLGFIKLGWKDPGLRRLLVKPLDLGRLARKWVRPSWLGAILAIGHRGIDRLVSSRLGEPETLAQAVDHFDFTAEELSRQVGVRYKGLILHRPHSWLTWRYKSNPWNRYQRFEVRTHEGRLQGLAVTNQEVREDICVGYVVDLLGESSASRRLLIQGSLKSLRDQGAELAVSVVSTPELIRDFRSQGFLPVPHHISPKRFFTVYSLRADHVALFQEVGSIDRWYQTLGDWDGI